MLAATGGGKTQVSHLSGLLQNPRLLSALPLPPSMSTPAISPGLGSAQRKEEARRAVWADVLTSLLSVSLLHVHCDLWDSRRRSLSSSSSNGALSEKSICRLVAVKVAPFLRGSSSSSSGGSSGGGATSSSPGDIVEFEVWRALLRASVPIPVAVKALESLPLYAGTRP